jgi:hypothetical protein
MGLYLEYWATPQGGFILSGCGDNGAVGVSEEAHRAMFDAYNKHDPYKQPS